MTTPPPYSYAKIFLSECTSVPITGSDAIQFINSNTVFLW